MELILSSRKGGILMTRKRRNGKKNNKSKTTGSSTGINEVSIDCSSWKDLQSILRDKSKHVISDKIAFIVFLSIQLRKPLLLEGVPGIGKTSLAEAVAHALQLPLYRIQCHEGLDETKVLYEWNYSKQILYTQVLREKIREFLQNVDFEKSMYKLHEHDGAFFSEPFLIERPLLKAIRSPIPAVLLIDEVDRADPEFEAFLLEVLAEKQVTIPELGTITATSDPLVFITSNGTRSLSDALRRRCLYLYLEYLDVDTEKEIISLKVPDLGEALLNQMFQFINNVRQLALSKSPSISELLDWATALVLLNAGELDLDVVKQTLNVLLKHQNDLETVSYQLSNLMVSPQS